MRRAAQEQVEVSQGLIKAAMDQVEGLSKPCLKLWAELRKPVASFGDWQGTPAMSMACR
jgi:hypothetical protein